MLSLERREDLRRNMPSKNKKSPMAFRPPGELKIGLCGRAPAETGSNTQIILDRSRLRVPRHRKFQTGFQRGLENPMNFCQ
jgi:hypothetical protein